MPRKSTTPNKNTAGDNSIVINGNVSNSNIIIGDNSSLTASVPPQQPEKLPVSAPQSVVESES